MEVITSAAPRNTAGGDVYTGRIVFVSETGGIWYIATPHPYHYRVVDGSRATQAVIAFLSHGVRLSREGEIIGGSEDLQGLVVRIDHEEYQQAMGRASYDR